MVAIPIPLSSAPGKTPSEGAGRLLNCYAEPLGDTARSKAVWRRVPGLSSFATSAETGYRGGQIVGSAFYGAWSGKVRRYDSAGTGTAVGNLSGTAKVFWARNNKTPTPDLVVVDPDNGAFVVTAGAVSSYPDPDLPAANSVDFLDGYFVFTIGDGRAFSSDLNDTAVTAINFGKAEAKPDGLIRGIAYGGAFVFFGTESTEVWTDTANPAGFPFSRATVIPRGLAGRSAVAGQESGFGGALMWVAENNTVVRLDGYTPTKVSPPDLDMLIEAVTDKTTLEAGVYVSGGHPKWVLSCPAWTWEFDQNTQKWNERASYGIARWRGSCPHYAFGKWLVGDTTTGNVLYVNSSSKLEVTSPLRYSVTSGPVQKFPYRVRVARADFDFAPGVGEALGVDPIATDPTVEISWSDDGGTKWSTPLLRKLGVQGKALQRVTVRNTGLSGAQGRRWRLEISDPVDVALMGGDQSAELRDH